MQEKNLEFLGYSNYSIFSDGNVMNVTTGKILGDYIDRYGYKTLNLHNSAGRKLFRVHRLIGLAFIPIVEGKNTIDHINRNKLDNRIENLKWADDYDQQHNTGLRKDNELGQRNIIKCRNLYRVEIVRNHIKIFHKYFKTLTEAIHARDDFLLEIESLPDA